MPNVLASTEGATLAAVENDQSYREVKSFLELVSLDVLAEASFNCGAYTRAFMHHEQFVRRSVSSQTCPANNSFDFLLVITLTSLLYFFILDFNQKKKKTLALSFLLLIVE